MIERLWRILPHRLRRRVGFLFPPLVVTIPRFDPEKLPEGQCQVCGCTQERACIGGCWWVADGLCSTCWSAR